MSVWSLFLSGHRTAGIALMAGDALVLWRATTGMAVVAISLGASTLPASASAMELGSAVPLSIQQLDRQRYVPRSPNAPGPPIVREVKKRVESLGRSLPFSQKIGKTKNITGFQFQIFGVPCSVGFEGTETWGTACGRTLGGK
jgi:hypothetical protein